MVTDTLEKPAIDIKSPSNISERIQWLRDYYFQGVRRDWFNKEVMVHYLPNEILPGDLLAGARFKIETSVCLTKKETSEHDR